VLPFCTGVLTLCVHLVIGNVLLCFLYFLAYLCSFGISDTRLFFPDLPADTWQLLDHCILGILGSAREALNSLSASAKASSDSFARTLCRYLHSNHSCTRGIFLLDRCPESQVSSSTLLRLSDSPFLLTCLIVLELSEAVKDNSVFF
jgi:hypothetical protein